MRYEVKGGVFPVVVCTLESGEQMVTERGSMVWQSPNIRMETTGGGLRKMFSKAVSGESMFQNVYTAVGGAGHDRVWFQLSRKDLAIGGGAWERDGFAKTFFFGVGNGCGVAR